MQYLGGIVENFMFECTDTNQLEVHTKAKFNLADSTLTFFIGKSKSDFFQKWDIPLNRVFIDVNIISSTMETWEELKIKGIEKNSVIQYTNKKSGKSELTKSFTIYLFDWCNEKKQENFIRALKRITELSKLK